MNVKKTKISKKIVLKITMSMTPLGAYRYGMPPLPPLVGRPSSSKTLPLNWETAPWLDSDSEMRLRH